MTQEQIAKLSDEQSIAFAEFCGRYLVRFNKENNLWQVSKKGYLSTKELLEIFHQENKNEDLFY